MRSIPEYSTTYVAFNDKRRKKIAGHEAVERNKNFSQEDIGERMYAIKLGFLRLLQEIKSLIFYTFTPQEKV